jgi:hypothetical protein
MSGTFEKVMRFNIRTKHAATSCAPIKYSKHLEMSSEYNMHAKYAAITDACNIHLKYIGRSSWIE